MSNPNPTLIVALAGIRATGRINMMSKLSIIDILRQMEDAFDNPHYYDLASELEDMNAAEWVNTLHRLGEFTQTVDKLREIEADQEPSASIFD